MLRGKVWKLVLVEIFVITNVEFFIPRGISSDADFQCCRKFQRFSDERVELRVARCEHARAVISDIRSER